MIILGVDPGLATVGFGIVKFDKNKFTAINYGAIITPPKIPIYERLQMIYNDLTRVIKAYKPTDLAVEELFYNTNQKTIIAIGEARGIILLAGQQNRLDIDEYTPLQVKQAVVGYGRAEKIQVMSMVTRILKLDKVPKPDDTADALAVAICHAHSKTVNSIFKK